MLTATEVLAADGTALRGEQVQRGDDWLVLVHELGADIDSFAPLSEVFADPGGSALALDLRGHGGSDGNPDASLVGQDVEAAVLFARDQGCRHLSLLAVGSSVDGALRAVAAQPADAYVLLSPPALPAASLKALREPNAGKLIFYGGHDDTATAAATSVRTACAGWASTVALPTGEQGTALIKSRWRSHIAGRLARFLGEQRHLGALTLRRY